MAQSPKQLEKAAWGRMFAYLIVWSAPAVFIWIVEAVLGLMSRYHRNRPDSLVGFGFFYGIWTVILWNYFGKKERELEERRLKRENICAFCKKQVEEDDLVYSMQLHRFVCGECLPPPES
jgi:hypothetical protein